MNGERPSWEELNAYVDGELSPPDRAEVAAALAARPALAHRVAVLSKLKAAAGEATETAAADDLLPPGGRPGAAGPGAASPSGSLPRSPSALRRYSHRGVATTATRG